jgi:hypothetical protein
MMNPVTANAVAGYLFAERGFVYGRTDQQNYIYHHPHRRAN